MHVLRFLPKKDKIEGQEDNTRHILGLNFFFFWGGGQMTTSSGNIQIFPELVVMNS
jgi:hypothetical protein